MIQTRQHISDMPEAAEHYDIHSAIAARATLKSDPEKMYAGTCVDPNSSPNTRSGGYGGNLYAGRQCRETQMSDGQLGEALPDLTIRMINAQEEERSRIARELHDDLGQKMALLSMELEQLGKMIPGQQDLREQIRTLQNQVLEISTDMHRLSHRLHPSKLDHLGLEAAVRGLCRDLDAAGMLPIDLYSKGDMADVPKDAQLCIFRIAQEALRNCAKHSGADSVYVVLAKTGGQVRLSVSDDGRGFDMGSQTINRGLGFTSMRERVRILGGRILVHSKPGRGTYIEASIPLADEI
jgi:signal transduction histidine kinase